MNYAKTLNEAIQWLKRELRDDDGPVDVAELLSKTSPKPPVFIVIDCEQHYRKGFTQGYAEALRHFRQLHEEKGFRRISECLSILGDWCDRVLYSWRYKAARDVKKGDFILLNSTPKFEHSTWKEIRSLVLERDEFSCAECGNPNKLQAVYIESPNDGGLPVLDNLQTVCQKCRIKRT